MLNFRRLKRDFSPAVLKEGKTLCDEGGVIDAKILSFDLDHVRIGANIKGNFDNVYESEVEIDRCASELRDSNCDCTYQYDCGHLAGLLFYLEGHLDEILVEYSKSADLDDGGEEEAQEIHQTLKAAEKKATEKKGKKAVKELLAEYHEAACLMGESLFFLPDSELTVDTADLAIIVGDEDKTSGREFQIALRLPMRSKPLFVPDIREFLEGIRYREPINILGRRYFFTMDSFDSDGREILRGILDTARFDAERSDRGARVAYLDPKVFGMLLAKGFEVAERKLSEQGYAGRGSDPLTLPCLFHTSLEQPLKFSPNPVTLRLVIEYLGGTAPKIFLRPTIAIDRHVLQLTDITLQNCAKPGLIHEGVYYRFHHRLRRLHLRDLERLSHITIPHPLFGSFVENALPELMRFAEVTGQEELENFVTLPFAGELKARCEIAYLDGELEAKLFFSYDDIEVPATSKKLTFDQAMLFVTEEGIVARNLVEERVLIDNLFDGFIFNPDEGSFVAKTDKKIVEFMTEVIPRHQAQVDFQCPENLLDQFLYDQTLFELQLCESDSIDSYTVSLGVEGHLQGLTLDRLWDAIASKKTYIELERRPPSNGRKRGVGSKPMKILVLDLDTLAPVVQFFDELGIKSLDNHQQQRPLWSLAGINPAQFEGLPVKITMTNKLQEVQQQILGQNPLPASPIPSVIDITLRSYQVEGVNWMERLRRMFLSGILADDMGLGKTVQAITAITQHKESGGEGPSLVVCPTSLLYNWKEEVTRFNSGLKTLVVDGTPSQRKKMIEKCGKYDVVVTSYSLIQKDVEHYASYMFAYAILDEAQHIKNRATRNAKSVKQIKALHRLILTGTPIENSLEELWSLFDFLMPGLLSSYERFVERYIRSGSGEVNLEMLNRKVSPFILRRMKSDVLKDLPPVDEQIYYCHLSKVQKELYQSYAQSAREELSRLVQKEGFDKVQIHVLATLTRLKQICCHPAIFAKETAEEFDSSKYEMMMELLGSLLEGKHKTVIFSQYTQMLKIMRTDLEKMGIRHAYLDGSSKNRLEICKSFNKDPNIGIFLVSLKAGGTGLNLTGADAVIHYDLWWNPAVQAQATDRVHRLGQNKPVTSYKLVTLGTIEEKVLELQKRKQGLVKQVVSADDEVVSKLSWEEVLELLQV